MVVLLVHELASWWNDSDSRLCDDKTHVRNTKTVSFEPKGPPVIHGVKCCPDDLSCFLALWTKVLALWMQTSTKASGYLLYGFVSYRHIKKIRGGMLLFCSEITQKSHISHGLKEWVWSLCKFQLSIRLHIEKNSNNSLGDTFGQYNGMFTSGSNFTWQLRININKKNICLTKTQSK